MTSNHDATKVKDLTDETSGRELLERATPLFVCGCARSGTTAFTDYLNQHEAVLLCQERYKGIHPSVSWNLFTFERIMDFRPEEVKKPPGGSLERYVQRHEELLSRKDPSKLEWLGDKGPFYVRHMDRLAGNNPGARFIILYRPLEEVAESWDARAKNPDDPWDSERGVELAVETWNAAMRKTREFIEESPAPRALIVTYHDFFYRKEAVVPQISRFLDLEFDESITKIWGEVSRSFEGGRRRKEPLTEEQQAFIREHADRDAEAWVLDRIDEQWRKPKLYARESDEEALGRLEEIEAWAWRLSWGLKRLERGSGRERRIKKRNRNLEQQLQEARRSKRRRTRRLKEQNESLTYQIREIKNSRTWLFLDAVGRFRNKVLRSFGK